MPRSEPFHWTFWLCFLLYVLEQLFEGTAPPWITIQPRCGERRSAAVTVRLCNNGRRTPLRSRIRALRTLPGISSVTFFLDFVLLALSWTARVFFFETVRTSVRFALDLGEYEREDCDCWRQDGEWYLRWLRYYDSICFVPPIKSKYAYFCILFSPVCQLVSFVSTLGSVKQNLSSWLPGYKVEGFAQIKSRFGSRFHKRDSCVDNA